MGYSREISQRATQIIFSHRKKAEADAARIRDRICAELPRVSEIEAALTECSISAVRAVVGGGNVSKELEQLAKKSRDMQQELKELLVAHGYDENALEVKYSCPKCCDKGAHEQGNKTVMCDCMRKQLRECACEDINKLSPLSLSTFDSFSLKYYQQSSESGVSPYQRMSRILDFCRRYAEEFSLSSGSLLMRGATGLGKTHLSLAIANEVLSSGFMVVYVSAPTLLSKLEREHFSDEYENERDTVETLMECDLLIIDDLGTEFSTQFTQTQIYNIFNTRISRAKPVIINTNMTVKELEAAYTQRFVSRVIGSCTKLDFVGQDIRALKSD